MKTSASKVKVYCVKLSVSAAATASISCRHGINAVKVTFFGWEEFIHREFEFVEKFTGIAVCGLNTFVSGNAEIHNRNEEFYFSCESDNCEKTDCNIYSLTVVIVN